MFTHYLICEVVYHAQPTTIVVKNTVYGQNAQTSELEVLGIVHAYWNGSQILWAVHEDQY